MATIDASIPLGVKPIQFESPVNQLAKILQVQEMQQGQQMNRLKMEEYQRGIQQKNAFRNALAAPDADIYKVLLQIGDVKGAIDWQKGQGDIKKTAAETDYKKLETAHKRADIMGQVFGSVRANPTVENAMMGLDMLEQLSVFPPEQIATWRKNAQANPASIAQFADQAFRQALSAKDQLPKIETRDAGGTLQTQSIDPVNGKVTPVNTIQKTATPGDLLTDARGRESNQISRGQLGVAQGNLNLRGQELAHSKGQGKAPAGYRFKPDGSLEPIPGGPASSKSDNASEGERKAATLLKRLEGSQAQLQAALKTNPGAAKPELLASGVRALSPKMEAVANSMTGTERQQVEAAQLDMLDAALTLGTGAAYTREQLEGYRKSYFPQIGDDQATVKDKQDRLNNVINAAKIAAGRAGPKTGAPAGGASGGWSIQKVQ